MPRRKNWCSECKFFFELTSDTVLMKHIQLCRILQQRLPKDLNIKKCTGFEKKDA